MTLKRKMPRHMPDVDCLYAEQFDKLVRYAQFLLGNNRHSAEDVVQEAFTRLIHQPLKDYRNTPAWLRTVVTHLCFDRLREINKHQEHSQILDAASPSAEDLSLQELDRQLLKKALTQLSSRDQEILWLRHNGYRYKEIAQKMGIDSAQVGMVLLRALKKLRQAYYTEQEGAHEQLSARPAVARVPRPRNN
ncbi:sigma-70 family RNA polymerase sigma factor [Sulfobacillus thermosulfidooxidans]|uniref:sigma-70 family RNA polymerase sigma factor n=1 Tax=Sulfobacillus thermosulfidooxidans TaxID=28034 RepID=UPI0006B5650B|nr:sigma-70 family RNA polymerase sigma factor [Sulfobacillus thermosulfidooxidans]